MMSYDINHIEWTENKGSNDIQHKLVYRYHFQSRKLVNGLIQDNYCFWKYSRTSINRLSVSFKIFFVRLFSSKQTALKSGEILTQFLEQEGDTSFPNILVLKRIRMDIKNKIAGAKEHKKWLIF